MSTWVILLFAVSSTIVKSDDYQGSTSSSPEVIREGYTPGSRDQINGESSPRAIFVYPPNGGSNMEGSSTLQHEGSHHSLVNRPGILHSRYVAGPRERESSKYSQLNILPLYSTERNLEYKNDRREDSKVYQISSNSAAHYSSHHSDNHQDYSSRHTGNHQDHSSHHSDNHQDYSSHHSDNHQDHSSHHSDNHQDYSSPQSGIHQDHSSHHLNNHQDHSRHHLDNPQEHKSHHLDNHQDHSSHHSGNHQDQSSHHLDNHQERKSHHSGNHQNHSSHHLDNHQEHKSHHLDNHQEHKSHHSGNHQEHKSHHSGNHQGHSSHHSGNHQDQSSHHQEHSSHHSGDHQDHSSHHSGNHQDQSSHHLDNHQEHKSHHSGNHQEHKSHHSGNHQGHSSHHSGNHQDQSSHHQEHSSHHSGNHQDHSSHHSGNHQDQSSHHQEHKSHHSGNHQYHSVHHLDNHPNQISLHLDDHQDKSSHVSGNHQDHGSHHSNYNQYQLPSESAYDGNRKETRNEQKNGFSIHNARNKSSAQNSPLPQSNDQYFDGSAPLVTYVLPPTGENHKQSLDRKTENLKYHNSASNPSEPNHYGFSSNHHDRTSGKSTSNTNYETNKGDLSYHSSKINHPPSILNTISSNPQDQSSEKSASRDNSVHSLHEGTLDQIQDRQQDHFKYDNPKSSPLVAFQSGISSNHHDQSTGIITSPHHFYGETNEKDRKNYPSDLKYPNPTINRPSMGFQSDYSSRSYNEIGLQDNLFRPPQRKIHSEKKDESKYIGNLSPSTLTHHNRATSKPTDQSYDDSFIHTVILQPHQMKNYWETHGSHQEDLGLSTPSIPSSTVHEGYKANGQVNLNQSTYHFTPQAQNPFEQDNSKSQGSKKRNPTTSPPNVLQNSYLQIPYNDTRANDHYKYKASHFLFGENHADNNKQLDHLKYKDITDFHTIQKDGFANPHIRTPDKAQDHTRYPHRDDTRIRPETEHNGHNQIYESKVPFRGSTELSQAEHENHDSKHHIIHLIENQQPSSKHPESHSIHDVPEHNVIHHEYSGYVPYRGPYTKPQVLHDRPNSHEVATVTVEPFGTPKAQPPKEFQPSSILNNQYPAEHTSYNVQTDSFTENMENQKYNQNRRNYGISGNGYPPFSPHVLYDYSTEIPKYQQQQPNQTQNENFPATVRPQTYEGFIEGNNYTDNYSFGYNQSPETYSGSPPQYSYTVPVISSQRVEDNLNSYILHNNTRNEQITSTPSLQTKPSYSYEGEYVNHLSSNNNAYHTGNQLNKRHNSSKLNSFLPIINHQTPTNYQNEGDDRDHYSSELIEHSRPYQEQNVRQVPVPNHQLVQNGPNNTNPEYVHDVVRLMNNGGYHNGKGHSFSTEHNTDTRIQQEYKSQAHPEEFTNQLLWQSDPLSNSPLVNPTAENFAPARTVQISVGQQDSIVHSKNHPSADHLDRGIHHEYALKFSFNKQKLTPQPLNFIPNSNQSEHFTVNPALPNYVGHLDSRNQHPSGLGLIDPQHVYAHHIPHHTLPAVKPMILQTGYQEDTHEISHAKHDHLHVHHSSQSGYQYGIIN